MRGYNLAWRIDYCFTGRYLLFSAEQNEKSVLVSSFNPSTIIE